MTNEPAPTPPIGLPLYRIENGKLVRDDLRGNLVLLKDARYALNGMQSTLASTEVGGLSQSHALVKAHKERGDMLRIWSIVGDVNSGAGMKQDIFERLTALMELMEAQKREIQRLRNQATTVTGTVRKEEPIALGWTRKEMTDDILAGRVFMRVTQASRPTEIRVTREELEACCRVIEQECPPVMRSTRKYVLFHNVELVPE